MVNGIFIIILKRDFDQIEAASVCGRRMEKGLKTEGNPVERDQRRITPRRKKSGQGPGGGGREGGRVTLIVRPRERAVRFVRGRGVSSAPVKASGSGDEVQRMSPGSRENFLQQSLQGCSVVSGSGQDS